MESEFHTHEQQLHIDLNAPFDAKHHSVSTIGKLHRHSFVTKLLCLEKMLLNVLTDCYWKTECPLLVLKQFLFLSCDFPRPFVQQVGRAGSLSKTLKDAAFGKIFDLMNDFGETEMPKGQRICKVFGVE